MNPNIQDRVIVMNDAHFTRTLPMWQIHAKQFTGTISSNAHNNFGGRCYYYLPYTNEETGTERKSGLSKTTLS